MLLEPAHMILLGDARAGDEPAFAAEIGQREVADQPAVFLQHRRQRHAAGLRQFAGQHPVEPRGSALRPSPCIWRSSKSPTGRRRSRTVRTSSATCAKSVERRHENSSLTPSGANHSGTSSPIGDAPLRALGRQQVVDRRRLQRPAGRQFLVGEADRKAPRIVLAHLGVGVGHRRPVAVARNIHRPDVGAGIAMRSSSWTSARPDATALAEAGHDAAGDPEAGQAAHRPDQRIAVRREGEGPVDDLLDAGVLEGREMPEADFQRRRDAVDVRLQQFMAEIPRRLELRPRLVGLLVGAHQHAAALLAQVKLAVEIDRMDDLRAGLLRSRRRPPACPR